MTVAPLADTLSPATSTTGTADGAEIPDGAFAALMHSLLADAKDGQVQDSEGDPGAFPATSDTGSEPPAVEDSDLAATLAALDLLLSQSAKPQVVQLPAEGSAGGTTSAIAAVDDDAILELQAAVVSPADEGSVDEAATELDTTSPAAAAETPMDVPGEQPMQADVRTATTEAPALDIETPAAPPSDDTEVPVSSASSPSGSAQGATSDSVVRSVGNADTPDNDPGQHRGRDKQGDTLPNASAQGIAHAAEPSRVAQFAVSDVAQTDQAPAPAADPVELPPALRQVSEAVLEQVDQSGGEAVIRLDPPELGSVLIRVQLRGDAVHVRVEAEHPSAMNLLRDHTQDLSNLLGERGLNLADVHVGHGGQGQSHNPGELPAWARRRRPGNNEFANILGIEGPSATQAHNRLQSAYNPDGRHIYRI